MVASLFGGDVFDGGFMPQSRQSNFRCLLYANQLFFTVYFVLKSIVLCIRVGIRVRINA